MIAMRCDRCGKYFDVDEKNYYAQWRNLNFMNELTCEVKTIDLCENCLKELKDFLGLKNKHTKVTITIYRE